MQLLGAVANVIGFASFNLRDPPLNYNSQHYSHSRQFRSNVIDESGYWKQIKID